jgi:hypothetical protein
MILEPAGLNLLTPNQTAASGKQDQIPRKEKFEFYLN